MTPWRLPQYWYLRYRGTSWYLLVLSRTSALRRVEPVQTARGGVPGLRRFFEISERTPSGDSPAQGWGHKSAPQLTGRLFNLASGLTEFVPVGMLTRASQRLGQPNYESVLW